jgi:hypothetical protein
VNYPGDDNEFAFDDALTSGDENENPVGRAAYELFDGEIDGDEEELDQDDELEMLGLLA